MGYIRHHAIVVTSFDDEKLKAAHEFATTLGCAVTEIIPGNQTFYSSFMVAADGSKEGWDESTRGDARRDALIEHMDATRYSDDSTAIDWVEVQYGDDDSETKICRDSDAHWRAKWADA